MRAGRASSARPPTRGRSGRRGRPAPRARPGGCCPRVRRARGGVGGDRRAAARGCAVEWARASRSARSLPLGAFAGVLRGGEPLPEGVELLARARQALAARAGGRRLVLCVDDGQLLDDASAALVHQLVAAGEALALVTLRRGEPTPDALRALWKDDLCVRLELGELPRDAVAALLGAALGGPVDGGSANALSTLTRGNALFLRELVQHGREQDRLVRAGGVWRW